jgi:coatomer subunit beta
MYKLPLEYVLHCGRILLKLRSFLTHVLVFFFWIHKDFTVSEKGDTKTKIEALKKTIHMIISGERLPGLLMTIIRFVLPLQDHMIKKLLLIFWEIVPKTTPDGKLMQEMILVCDSYRKVWCSYSSGRNH